MTLTQAAYWTKRLGIVGAFGFLGLFIGVIILLNIPTASKPAEYLTPTNGCSASKTDFLSYELNIPSLSITLGVNPVYQQETPSGRIENLPNIVNVYKYVHSGQSLDSLAKATNIATLYKFTGTPTRPTSTQYVWKDDYSRVLTVDARTMNYTITMDYTRRDILPKNSSKLPTESEAIRIAQNFLSSTGLTSDYTAETPQTTYIGVDSSGNFYTATKSEAVLIRVDFVRSEPLIQIRADLDGAETMKANLENSFQTARTDTISVSGQQVDVYNFEGVVRGYDTVKSNVYVYVGVKNDTKTIKDNLPDYVYGVNYVSWEVAESACGTYSLIGGADAVTAMRDGRGSLVYLQAQDGDPLETYTQKTVTQFTVYQMYLGYYDTPNEQPYLQPIYIISGTAKINNGVIADFIYYVPAVNYSAIPD